MMMCAHHTMQSTHSASSSEVRYCRRWPWVELGFLQMLEKWAKSAAASDIIIKLQKQPAGGFENILKISQDCSYHFLSLKQPLHLFFNCALLPMTESIICTTLLPDVISILSIHLFIIFHECFLKISLS